MKHKLYSLKHQQKHEFEKKIQPSDSKFEFAGGVANWSRLGYELSVVNITTDVVWIPSNWLIADDIER